jgi:hypothetical protein
MRIPIAMASVLVAVLALTGCETPRAPLSHEFRSPRNTYTVRIWGHTTRAYTPLFHHVVRAEILKGSSRDVAPQEIHFSDWFDTAFGDEYVGTEWPQENVLRFKWLVAAREPGAHQITIENQTPMAVRFLRLRAGDLFLVLDLPPGATAALGATPQRPMGDLSWISADGEFADNTRIHFRGFNFILSGPRGTRHHYLVKIAQQGVTVSELAHGARIYGGE